MSGARSTSAGKVKVDGDNANASFADNAGFDRTNSGGGRILGSASSEFYPTMSGGGGNSGGGGDDEVRRRMAEAAEARRAKGQASGTLRDIGYHTSGTRTSAGGAAAVPAQPQGTTTTTGTTGASAVAPPVAPAPALPQSEASATMTPAFSGGFASAGEAGGMGTPVPSGADESNPVLRAAMLRRAASGAASGPAMTPAEMDKARVLNDVRAELRRQGKEEPFGIAASDATKLRVYLAHLRGGA